MAPADLPPLDRAQALIDRGRLREAATELQAVLATTPDDLRALCLLSLVELQRHHPDDALLAAGTATAHHPTDEWGHRMRARALVELHRTDEALAAALEAARLAPHEWRAFTVLAVVYLDVPDPQAAVVAARRAAELAPGEPEPHLLAARAALRAGAWDDAEAWYRAALRLAPGSTEAIEGLARSLEAQGRVTEAAGVVHAAGGLHPGLSGTRGMLPGLFHLLVFRVALAAVLALSLAVGALFGDASPVARVVALVVAAAVVLATGWLLVSDESRLRLLQDQSALLGRSLSASVGTSLWRILLVGGGLVAAAGALGADARRDRLVWVAAGATLAGLGWVFRPVGATDDAHDDVAPWARTVARWLVVAAVVAYLAVVIGSLLAPSRA